MPSAHFTRPLLCLGLVFLALFATHTVKAQVLIYRFEFEEEGDRVNFEFFDGGFAIIQAPGGANAPAAVVLTFHDFVSGTGFARSLRRFYLERNVGELFFIEDTGDGETYGVYRISGAQVNEDTTTWQAFGELGDFVRIGGGLGTNVVERLKGMALSSGPEVEVDRNDDGLITDEAIEILPGFAGMVEMEMRFDRGRTREINDTEFQISVGEAADIIITELEQDGFLNADEFAEGAPPDNGDGNGDGNGNGDGGDNGTGDPTP